MGTTVAKASGHLEHDVTSGILPIMTQPEDAQTGSVAQPPGREPEFEPHAPKTDGVDGQTGEIAPLPDASAS